MMMMITCINHTFITSISQQLGQLWTKHQAASRLLLDRFVSNEASEEVDKLSIPPPGHRNLIVMEARVLSWWRCWHWGGASWYWAAGVDGCGSSGTRLAREWGTRLVKIGDVAAALTLSSSCSSTLTDRGVWAGAGGSLGGDGRRWWWVERILQIWDWIWSWTITTRLLSNESRVLLKRFNWCWLWCKTWERSFLSWPGVTTSIFNIHHETYSKLYTSGHSELTWH